MIKESDSEKLLIGKLGELKYTWRSDVWDRNALEHIYYQKFEALNSVHLTEVAFNRLQEEIITQHSLLASKTLRERNTFQGKTILPCITCW